MDMDAITPIPLPLGALAGPGLTSSENLRFQSFFDNNSADVSCTATPTFITSPPFIPHYNALTPPPRTLSRASRISDILLPHRTISTSGSCKVEKVRISAPISGNFAHADETSVRRNPSGPNPAGPVDGRNDE
ncbi:hypothetical protein CC78DRAFT_313867 [Lojkania enalia]|uniref:Uncharacterized protein n=1 Tax=Lojkania enalia TaxID=147567 RepID=A0A9P4K5R8_9PLEO|nr:hypothetical protein CC78DRAFT_313867 [Didymosphaeria enalia]